MLRNATPGGSVDPLRTHNKEAVMNASTRITLAAALAAMSVSSHAADWSDTYIGYRYGTQFREPFNPDDIAKNIFNLSHVSGYRFGTNFFNVDMLLSDDKDPAGAGSTNGAHEVYVVYRHMLDIEKISGAPMKFGPVRGLGLTAGFDFNAKTDAGYNSKKRMLVLGPTLMFDVPGFLNASVVALWESNAPYNTFTQTSTPRYTYDTHGALLLAWAIPLSKSFPLTWEGYANFIASKGKNEFGDDTAAETNIDMQLMYDVSTLYGGKNTFKLGVQYQYWRNKFGNDASGPAGSGAYARTPMVRAQYHF
jgi:nucleoside-specific outer membrane channel protein Tsx